MPFNKNSDHIHTKPVSELIFPKHFTPSFWGTEYTPWQHQNEINKSVKDPLTDELYLNDSRNTIRLKCFLLAIAVPIVYSCLVIASIIWSIIIVLIIFGMWCCNNNNARDDSISFEILKLLLVPLLLIAAEVTVILGLIFPLNARKIFGSIERLFIDNYDVPYDLAINRKLKCVEKDMPPDYITDYKNTREVFEKYSSFRDILDVFIIYDDKLSNIFDAELNKCLHNNESIDEMRAAVCGTELITYHERQRFILAKCFQPSQEIPAKYVATQGKDPSYSISYS